MGDNATAPAETLNNRECNQCGKTFTTKGNLKQHYLVHSDQRPFQCPVCPKAFKSNRYLGRHVSQHTGFKPFECPSCQKPFIQKCHRHTQKGLKKCHHCNNRFKTNEELKAHLITHTKKRKLIRIACTCACVLDRHLMPHTKEKLHNSTECRQMSVSIEGSLQIRFYPKFQRNGDYSGDEKGTPEVRMRQHTNERPFQCHLNPRTFKQGDQLRCHIREVGGKKFMQFDNLKEHEETHEDEENKEFKYGVSGREFRDKPQLTEHAHIHSDQEPITCDSCNTSFRSEFDFNSHLISMEGRLEF